jgi:DNA-binding NtrC family response regulator
MIHKAAQVVADVLIIGETGTGKELTAEAIHRESSRADGPFISINCGALDENLLLDALFGHVKGAFSNAKSDRKGAFLAASGGTLLLDEIGNASAKVQQALLRALSARTIRPLGSDQSIPFDARVIAATNVDLLECAKN